MKRQLELVHWVDSHSAGGVWMDPARLGEEMAVQRIITLGWVVFEDDDRLILSSSHDENWEQVGEVLSIAKVSITERRRVSTPTALGDDMAVAEPALRAIGEGG